jgi:hypothetical protein
MALADNFLRQIEVLEKALAAKKSGLPEALVVLTYSDHPQHIEDATQRVFARYGVDRDIVEAAHSRVVTCPLPWAAGRSIGVSSRNDPRINWGNTSIESEDPSCIGAGFRGAKPKADHSPDTSLTEDPIG